MNGISLPKSAKHALELGSVNRKTVLKDILDKEIEFMMKFKVFRTIAEGIDLKRQE